VSFHPNDVIRRARTATALIAGAFLFLIGAFFRTQVLEKTAWALQSEKNRLNEIPLPAPRGIIFDRHGEVIAENLPGYSVLILSPSADSLRASLRRLSELVPLSTDQIEAAVRRLRRAPNRPTVVLADAPFDVISVLEEHRIEFPDLLIQSAPKRYYPDKESVASFVGYTGEVTESELNSTEYATYKSGQQIGKAGLEKQYEEKLRGREGTRFVEVDARGRVVREAPRQDIAATPAPALQTSIDLDLQRFIAQLYGDSLQGGVIALEPKTGEVLALHSAPSFDPNKFVGGVSSEYYKQLIEDPRRPLYNKVIQGKYPPGSTFKLATAVLALANGVASLEDHMPQPCTGGYWYGSRYFRCHKKEGHGNVTLAQAIEKSCDVYFYQLGLKLGLARLLAGGVSLNFREKSGIDLPNDRTPDWPYAIDYFNKKYGPQGWTQAVALNLSIGQGENSQTVANMARFYTALATGGMEARPRIVKTTPEREKVFTLTAAQFQGIRAALGNVVSRGTAASAQIQNLVIGGKTGTAQTGVFREGVELNHAWFVGLAPNDDPKIVIAVMLEFGGHGDRAARIATKIIEHYLKRPATLLVQTEG
jgi:penicillin-binding protein 2